MRDQTPHPELDPKSYGFTEADMDRPIFIDNVLGLPMASMRQIIEIVKRTYCGTFALQYMHISDPEQASWLKERIEGFGKEIAFTRVACRLLDGDSCRCAQYEIRHQFVPECITLDTKNIERNLYWLPETCAYKLLWQGKPLYDWHPLVSGTAQSVHDAGMSVAGWTVPEFEVDEDDWEDHIIEEPV